MSGQLAGELVTPTPMQRPTATARPTIIADHRHHQNKHRPLTPPEQTELGYNASDQLQNAWHIHLNVISNPTPSVIIFYIRLTLVVPWLLIRYQEANLVSW